MAVDSDKIGGLWLVYGIPGTGKTLLGGLADGLIPALRRGRRVYTNITGLSVAGCSSVAGVPPLSVDIRLVESVGDILAAFDASDSVGSLFILDEMRQVLGADEKNENWLSQRLNVMRKRGIDFIMIAQVPTYFSTDLRELARGCSLFKRMYGLGSSSRTREYRFDGGTPKMSGGKPQAAGFSVRKLPAELFTCYSSYIDEQITGSEDKGRKNAFWKSPRAIIAYGFIFAVLLMLGFALFMFLNIKDSFGSLSDSISGRAPVVSSSQNKAVEHEKKDVLAAPCYNWALCDSLVCKTDAGEFYLSSRLDGGAGFLTPGGMVPRCDGH